MRSCLLSHPREREQRPRPELTGSTPALRSRFRPNRIPATRFRGGRTNTSSISIGDMITSSTTAVVNGPGMITGQFNVMLSLNNNANSVIASVSAGKCTDVTTLNRLSGYACINPIADTFDSINGYIYVANPGLEFRFGHRHLK